MPILIVKLFLLSRYMVFLFSPISVLYDYWFIIFLFVCLKFLNMIINSFSVCNCLSQLLVISKALIYSVDTLFFSVWRKETEKLSPSYQKLFRHISWKLHVNWIHKKIVRHEFGRMKSFVKAFLAIKSTLVKRLSWS